MFVEDFCNYESMSFPQDFFDCLPVECPDCGMPMEMSETLTGLHCSNYRCPSKVAQRLVAIANALGVKDLGESRARKFVDECGITNPLDIFEYNPDIHGQMAVDISEDMSRKIAEQFQERRRFTLAEYVRIAQLPNIQTSAFALFDGYDDINRAYAAIEKGEVEYIRDRLSIKEKGSEDISVRALKIYESLMIFKEDLIRDVQFVDIIPLYIDGMVTLKAVCSSKVGGGYKTKAEFYAKCNSLYPNVHIEFGSSVTKNTDYLIWAGGDVTAKVKKARGYGVVIVTAEEFINILGTLSQGEAW